MARFDVYTTPFADERRAVPYWLDIQADHLSHLVTRVIVPLRRASAARPPMPDLNPQFEVDGVAVYLDTANVAGFPKALLKRPLANLRAERLAIEDAIDFLFTGL
jgi:toxin CcdB